MGSEGTAEEALWCPGALLRAFVTPQCLPRLGTEDRSELALPDGSGDYRGWAELGKAMFLPPRQVMKRRICSVPKTYGILGRRGRQIGGLTY